MGALCLVKPAKLLFRDRCENWTVAGILVIGFHFVSLRRNAYCSRGISWLPLQKKRKHMMTREEILSIDRHCEEHGQSIESFFNTHP